MKAKRYTARVFLHDELPRIGCGWRKVTIKPMRRKGIHYLHVTCCASGRTQKIVKAAVPHLCVIASKQEV